MVFLNKTLTNLREFKTLQHILLLKLNNMNTSHLLFVSYSDSRHFKSKNKEFITDSEHS